MSATQSLYKYLTDSADVAGHASRLFVNPISINGWTIATRNDARRLIRDQVGRAIFADRRPQDSSGHTAIILRTLGSDPDYNLSGPELGTVHFIEVDVFARGGDSAERCERIARLVEIAVSGYHGDYWGEEYIGECIVDRDGTAVYEPGDASDNWTHRYTMDLRVLHSQPVPEYSSIPLQAAIEFPLAFGEGDYLLMSAAGSIPPTGRVIADVHWVLTKDGAPTISFDGPPDFPADLAGVTGTNLDPGLLRSSFTGLDSGTWSITLTIADDDGITSTVSREWR